MTTRRFKTKPNDTLTPCPKCGNNTEFVCHSEQVAEDGCEVWVKCKCGFDPFTWRDKLESVMGGCDDDNCLDALGCWNDAFSENSEIAHSEQTTKG